MKWVPANVSRDKPMQVLVRAPAFHLSKTESVKHRPPSLVLPHIKDCSMAVPDCGVNSNLAAWGGASIQTNLVSAKCNMAFF